MESLGEIVSCKLKIVSCLEKEKVKNNLQLTTLDTKDRAIGIAGDLAVVGEPKDMTAWYCKVFRTIGEGKYTACAKAAKAPGVRNQKRMFSWLLKSEMSAAESRAYHG